MSTTEQNMYNAIKSLVKNGFSVYCVDEVVEYIAATNTHDEVVKVSVAPNGLCYVSVDDCIITNASYPFLVGEAARLRRHVGLFENVTKDTKV